jgi:D-alanyl-D-alanine carboxypeptidase
VVTAPSAPVADPVTTAPHNAHNGWVIQIGAFDRETEAKQRLAAAQTRAKTLLSTADAFTERVMKGDKALYRARFAGLDKEQAEAACQYLKRNEIVCMALKN